MKDTVKNPSQPRNLRFLGIESADDYRSRSKDHLDFHALAEFRRDAHLYYKRKSNPIIEEERPSTVLDRAAHVAILQGHSRYWQHYALGGPVDSKTGEPFGRYTRAFERWAAVQGKPVLTNQNAALIERLYDSVHSHKVAVPLLADGVADGVVRCTYLNQPCQARIDWVSKRPDQGIVDLQITDSLACFDWLIRAFGFVHQLAFYRSLVAVCTQQSLPVHLIAVEKCEPFRCGVWHIPDKTLRKAATENEQAMHELAKCQASSVWPTGFESMREVDRL